jgi:hypothetical protein
MRYFDAVMFKLLGTGEERSECRPCRTTTD